MYVKPLTSIKESLLLQFYEDFFAGYINIVVYS